MIVMIVNAHRPLYYHGFGIARLNLDTFCSVNIENVIYFDEFTESKPRIHTRPENQVLLLIPCFHFFRLMNLDAESGHQLLYGLQNIDEKVD